MFTCSKVQRSRFSVSLSDHQAQSSLVRPGKAKNFYFGIPFFKTRPYSTRRKSRCRSIFRAAKTPEMSFRPNKQPAVCHRGRAPTQFIQWVSAQHFELVTPFNHDQFPRAGDAEEPSIHPNRGTKVIATDPFLIMDRTSGCAQTGDDAS